ncbi:MAG TPA: pantetheine-phosphate adenylyltransferase [Prevotella sp.]|nr:pantetheine-phosphate adenylyltransferase [Prevotella sp.]
METEHKLRIGVFTGTFDPFTIGHQNITERALKLFDELYIAIAVSKRKNTEKEIEERLKDIDELYTDNNKVKVITYSDLTVDMCKRIGADTIVRGVRSIRDFEYEREQADINKQMGGVETLLLFAEPRFESISSTLVRELKFFGRDVTEFLPEKK